MDNINPVQPINLVAEPQLDNDESDLYGGTLTSMQGGLTTPESENDVNLNVASSLVSLGGTTNNGKATSSKKKKPSRYQQTLYFDLDMSDMNNQSLQETKPQEDGRTKKDDILWSLIWRSGADPNNRDSLDVYIKVHNCEPCKDEECICRHHKLGTYWKVHLKELNIVAVPQRTASDQKIDFQDLSKDDEEDGAISKPGETKAEKEENAAPGVAAGTVVTLSNGVVAAPTMIGPIQQDAKPKNDKNQRTKEQITRSKTTSTRKLSQAQNDAHFNPNSKDRGWNGYITKKDAYNLMHPTTKMLRLAVTITRIRPRKIYSSKGKYSKRKRAMHRVYGKHCS